MDIREHRGAASLLVLSPFWDETAHGNNERLE